MTQVSQAQGQHQCHQGNFVSNKTGKFTLTSQGYVAAKHEDLSMPAMAATPTSGGKAIMLFTLSGNGGPTGAGDGGFFPSTALTADQHLRRPARLQDQHRGPGQVPPGRLQRVPGLPRSYPAPLGRLQLGILPAGGPKPAAERFG